MCYAVSLAAALTSSAIYAKTKNGKIYLLNLMLWGGALFGFIDHLWNKELFFISKDIANDLLLGLVITLAIFFVWGLIILFNKANFSLPGYLINKNK